MDLSASRKSLPRILALRSLPLALGLILSTPIHSQTISSRLIGNNAWMSSAFNRGGEMERLWGQMKTGKFQLIRIGGAGSLGDNKTMSWVLQTIDGIRSTGAEPLVQVPSDYSEAQAADYITQINVTNRKNIRYWSIGNEPDWQNSPNNTSGHNPQGVDLTESGVGTYTKRISQGLKSVDPTILVFAGEFAWYNDSYTNALLGGSGDCTGKDKNGNYYIDGISWHHYGSNDLSPIEGEADKLRTLFAKFDGNRPAGRKLQWMLGEFNMTVDNSQVAADQKCWSFHAGQLFAQVYDLGMRKGAFTIAPWSMHESGGARISSDLGIFDGTNGNYSGRSSYWHSLMLGQNMKTTYLSHTQTQTAVTVIPMGDTSGSAVMLVNTDAGTDYPYTVRLDNATISGNSSLKVSVNAGIAQQATGTLAKASTQMLVFDRAGNLVKRYTYTSANADQKAGPVVDTFKAPTGVRGPWSSAPSGSLQAFRTARGLDVRLPSGAIRISVQDLQGRNLFDRSLSGESDLHLDLDRSPTLVVRVRTPEATSSMLVSPVR